MSKIQKIIQILEKLFPNPDIPLKHSSSYTLLIATLLSARCTDERVNTVTPLLFQKADTAEKMTKLSVATIQAIIKPCGLSPTKARAIKALSLLLVQHHKGDVPQSFEELEALPGVGHKTASVVMAQAFHVPAFPVDTHIHRLAKRWKLSSGKNVKQTEKDLKKAFPKTKWIQLHLQMIYFGRKYCPARGHEKSTCPICSFAN